jgi:hypothetical protein
MNRVKRPDTWLHRPMLQNVTKALANPEPSTHDLGRVTQAGPIRDISVLAAGFPIDSPNRPLKSSAMRTHIESRKAKDCQRWQLWRVSLV